MSARWAEHRQICKRYRIIGTLSLLTPARFGGGEDGQLTDMPVLRDPQTGNPLLPGASIAGAMRAYLREWELGYEQAGPERVGLRFQQLFGHVVDGKSIPQKEKQSRESFLVVEDSIAQMLRTEFRPGVKIDPRTRMAAVEQGKGGQLFDMELLESGTSFPLCFELALPDDDKIKLALLEGLAIALTGFTNKEIGLGARKRRGFGECQVEKWQVQEYNLKDPRQLVAWIEGKPGQIKKGKTIAKTLGLATLPSDQRQRFCLEAHFKIDTSLLIRSGSGQADSPDMVHLQSKRQGKDRLILSGTSLAGAIRGRALRIAKTMIPDDVRARKLVAEIFGPEKNEERSKRRHGEEPIASRALVREREVEGGFDLVQSRIRIDRFTGGVYPGALFEQQPVFGGKDSKVCVSIELRNPEKSHIGLLLHLLKDLWTGDLPLGGEAGVGRGRLKGVQADLSLHMPEKKTETWRMTAKEDDKLHIAGKRDKLEKYAKAVGGAK